jgi:hypothetical protein
MPISSVSATLAQADRDAVMQAIATIKELKLRNLKLEQNARRSGFWASFLE